MGVDYLIPRDGFHRGRSIPDVNRSGSLAIRSRGRDIQRCCPPTLIADRSDSDPQESNHAENHPCPTLLSS